MKKPWIIGIVMIALALTGCSPKVQASQDKMMVVVGIAPMKEWVETIVEDTMEVVVMIPPGYSPANYEPTTKQLLDLEKMEVYFAIGVGAETEGFLTRVFDDQDPKLISLYEEVAKALPDRFLDAHAHEGDEDSGHEEEAHSGRDPHIWLSIPRTILMVEMITDELVEINPQEEMAYRQRSEAYIQDLQVLDQELKDDFLGASKTDFLLFHPSLGYFADDYGLTMHVIEDEGKSATPTHLMEVIDLAKAEGIDTVFYQAEFDENQARTIAQELDGDLVPLAILQENYMESMREIGHALLDSMK